MTVRRSSAAGPLLACLVVLVCLALSACGSSSSKSSTASSTASPASSASQPSATSSKPSGSAINIGTICSCSGAEASILGGEATVLQAWVKSVNASGGINGHPVNLIIKDDGQDPATSLQDAKELIQQDHVMAFVGEMSEVDSSFASYVASQGVPVVGGNSTDDAFMTNPDFYPSGSLQLDSILGLISLAKKAGKSHFADVYCAETPICAQVIPLTQNAATAAGLKFSSTKISATAPSYTAPCLTTKSEGVDAMFVVDNGPVTIRFLAACAQQDYSPLQVTEITATTPSVLTAAGFTGALLTGPDANPFDTSTPGIAQFQAAVAKYAPSLKGSALFDYDTILPWSGAELFEAAAKAADIGPSSTAADVKKGLYALKNETLDGISPPLNFSPGKVADVPCFFTTTIKGGKFVSLDNDKPTCLTAAQLKAAT